MNNFKQLIKSTLTESEKSTKEELLSIEKYFKYNVPPNHPDYKKVMKIMNNKNMMSFKDIKWLKDVKSSWKRRHNVDEINPNDNF